MLSVRGVTKKYAKVLANDNIDFDVSSGEISVLLGPNGAGKSTIIKCIAGLLKYTGSIKVNGHDNKSIAAKRELAYIPEVPAPYPMLTVWEHLEFIARAYSLSDWTGDAQVLLERFEMDDKKKKLGSDLSKGMQQKLSLCCGLLPRPRLILFDEPMIGLDPHAIKQIKDIIVEQKNAGGAIIISTHMLDSVAEFWDTTHIMMDGRIEASRRRSDGTENEGLEDLYFEIVESKRQAKRAEQENNTNGSKEN
ncbi:MAG: ABC transporter ATP-binding protein [Caldicoprobacterales bacterium]|jgi:ABC-2 type transport system ATP-binding protein|nr:ABC transporter ATP-binding protein [Clostridia bacterium]